MHVPSVPASVHDWQAPVHALSQQTPCAQLPDVHSVAAEQDAPMLFVPHEFIVAGVGRQAVGVDGAGVEAGRAVADVGLQGSGSGATHWPVELQAEGGV